MFNSIDLLYNLSCGHFPTVKFSRHIFCWKEYFMENIFLCGYVLRTKLSVETMPMLMRISHRNCYRKGFKHDVFTAEKRMRIKPCECGTTRIGLSKLACSVARPDKENNIIRHRDFAQYMRAHHYVDKVTRLLAIL